MKRTYNTLFMIESVDGKISTGSIDDRDVDKDFPIIDGVKEGLHQYYDIEKTTDPFSLNSGRVMAKIGVNTRENEPTKMGCSFIIIDNTHLTENGVKYLVKWVKKLFLVTTNKNHPAYKVDGVEIVEFEDKIEFGKLFERLSCDFGIERITLQSGGTLNAEFVRQGLVDEINIVVAPCLIGGKDTSTLMDGENINDLQKIKALELIECKTLENSYIQLRYKVIN